MNGDHPAGPYAVAVDHGRRTILITGRGTATTEETIALIERQAATFRANPGYNVIYDSSALEIESSATDMVRVSTALFGSGLAAVNRFAVVVPEKRAPLARMFTALAQSHGINANVFTDAADAWRWLGVVCEG